MGSVVGVQLVRGIEGLCEAGRLSRLGVLILRTWDAAVSAVLLGINVKAEAQPGTENRLRGVDLFEENGCDSVSLRMRQISRSIPVSLSKQRTPSPESLTPKVPFSPERVTLSALGKKNDAT